MGGLKKGVTTKDMGLLISSAKTFFDFFPGEESTIANVYKNAAMVNQYQTGTGDGLTKEGSKLYTDQARYLAEQYRKKRAENPFPKKSRTGRLLEQLMYFVQSQLDLMAGGTSEANNPELGNDEGAYLISTFIPQMNVDCFDKKNFEKTEKYLEIFPLDRLFEDANKLHDKNVEFHKNRNDRTLSENKEKLEEIRQEKNKFLPQVDRIHSIAQRAEVAVSLEMEDVIKGLFGDRDYCMDPVNGFIGGRGLQTAANRLKRDQLIEPAQISLFEQSMEKFNSSRAFVFKKESTEHKQMREFAEKVQKNMRMLETGDIYDEKIKGSRKLTAVERLGLMNDTYRELVNLEEKTEQYIKHATPDGKEPRTPAGKARLAGARDMLEITSMFKESLIKDPNVKQYASGLQAAEVISVPLGESRGANAVFARMEKKFTEFERLGTTDAGNNRDATGGGAYGLTDFEYMAAQMIATATVKETVTKNGSVPGNIGQQIGIETGKICKEEDFRVWIRNIDKEELSKKNADGVRKDFTDALSRKLFDSDAEKTKDKKEPVKEETKKEIKKETKKEIKKETKKVTKIDTPKKIIPEPVREN